MSLAGIRSNRGDGYQTLVAFDWALEVLSDPDYLWLEIDSVTYSVDDVVIGKADGGQIACQCKKNQPDFKAWTITDLADELDKAFNLLTNYQNAEVRFYSRNNFGILAKLREHSSTQYDEASYKTSLGKELHAIDTALSKQLAISTSNLSTYEFLRRTKFETTGELDRMTDHLRERLGNIASNPDAAFNALWVCLDQLGARMGGNDSSAAARHRLTKDDLKTILHKSGSILSPPIDLAEARLSFSGTSAIGRSWKRDIAGQRIASPVVNELLSAINAKKRAILLTGLPGSGKTCAMIALQEILEQQARARSDIVPIFIQSRDFADLTTSKERHVHGLSEHWVEKAARLAEDAHVVVVMDSLDVLSIARDHRVLTYFLAQIDRLLLIPNITVVTACRDFDRHYDRRIAERQWDFELKCMPLKWDAETTPLLDTLGIATGSIDAVTQELISNPRELALFVELAQREGSFNVVTSQALAQRYLDTIVRTNRALGNAAMQAIEAIASEMLKLRSLTVPHQRFTASQDIQRELCSLNVLQVTQDGKLTFGHQTLLDVLVISGATRSDITLNKFIQGLPPVPFVRPSIRNFVAQLALAERRQFRKQLRPVLTGSIAFHIKRLVAESFAEQAPQDDDWSLICELREKHYDVFQVLYTSAKAIEWHHFWLKHLVPALKNTKDVEGIAGHAYRIAQWSNEDCKGVLSFWMEALSLDWFDSNEIADRLGIHLSEIKHENLGLVPPLLERLLEMPRPEHSFLGRVIARCIEANVIKDALLWRYMTDEITDEDLLQFRLDNKLRCQAHEFGDEDNSFISTRMKQSSALLDLALESIERWSNVQKSRYGETRIGYRHGFLGNTSFENTHSQREIHHVDSMNVLFNGIETAILHHASTNSDWWKHNSERLCFNHEGALLYLAILACVASPETNIDVIGRMLCDKNMLEFKLSYELGELLRSAFRLFNAQTQDAVIVNILTMWNEIATDEINHFWILEKRAELIAPIPCYLRSPETQAVVDSYEKKAGILTHQPQIHSRGGVVVAPFSFEVFLSTSDTGVVNLLKHYKGYSDWRGHEAGSLIGGEREVGSQLQEASSRHPMRFLSLLSFQWTAIPENFRDDIMNGIASYLAYRCGNRQTNGAWQPVEEPDLNVLTDQILDELDRHPKYWQCRRSAANAIEVCANVIQSAQQAEQLIFLAVGFVDMHEVSSIIGNKANLIAIGINTVKGHVADALMTLANNFLDLGNDFPELLTPTLRRVAGDEHPAIRALILRRLSYLQSKSFDLGWDLFHIAMQDANGLWQIAEPCLYYAYHNHPEIVKPLLERLCNEGNGKDLETWGRISALLALSQRINFDAFLKALKALNSTDAWQGAATVWTNSENIWSHKEQCVSGMDAGLNAGGNHAKAIAEKIYLIFRENAILITIPIDLIRCCFSVFKNNSRAENKHHRLSNFHEWLNAISRQEPEYALTVTEIYLDYVSHCKPYIYDHENSLAQLITRLFAEAEEREESSSDTMLQRVVAVQDTLLSLGINSVQNWLKAAERP